MITLAKNDDAEDKKKRFRRLFIAIPILEETKRRLKRQLKEIPGHRVPEERWHFTIAFLGNVPDEKLESLIQLFNEISLPNSFDITFTGLGAFPRMSSAHILWIGLKESEALNLIYQRFQTVLGKARFLTEERQFVPHITVSRFPRAKNVRKWLEGKPFVPVLSKVEHIILFQSILGDHPPEYIELCRRELTSHGSIEGHAD